MNDKSVIEMWPVCMERALMHDWLQSHLKLCARMCVCVYVWARVLWFTAMNWFRHTFLECAILCFMSCSINVGNAFMQRFSSFWHINRIRNIYLLLLIALHFQLALPIQELCDPLLLVTQWLYLKYTDWGGFNWVFLSLSLPKWL